MADVYSYSLQTSKGELKLGDHKDKNILIVNVASRCGLTPQYKDLQALSEKYAGKLEIIGQPCNQFKAQEPGTDDEILLFCQGNYGVTFPIARKGDVNGPEATPLFQYLKSHAEPPVQDIDWNFSKFLIRPGGKIQWFPARSTKVSDVEAAL
ncbi:glutathione peroxidase [Cutaneotrichosporon oleaginosum]|uniref:Glutathione peroxidase n=1 Tax=Cutaneotrichosporon oleaginosum TaxID=879819 RepID=A0A0J0XNN0_9TREE|nr:glutathione peroxidase [Cutaneotrichosporon oleaginosum]KLT42731.1 glutathione peroxidase [Cutaneotrichosporon oleaginosum]TXT09550.1 hypothetical protein COLE_03484 [Cutaneotrichosporon oleaginosum]